MPHEFASHVIAVGFTQTLNNGLTVALDWEATGHAPGWADKRGEPLTALGSADVG